MFVTLRSQAERPEYYVVPSKVVASRIRQNHKLWLATPGRRGQKHKDNPLRMFRDYRAYREKWEILGL